jgi:tetratricopeptide (TPR) repeat protein
MSRERSSSRAGDSAASSRRTPPKPSPPACTRTREWVFRFLAIFVVPLVFVACLECALRLSGYGYSTAFFKPLKIAGQNCLVDNDDFGLRFFPPALARIPVPVVMKAAKPAGTIRIFLLGESAALGDPRPQFGAGRYLEALLRERIPGQDFEVVNVAMTAINSHVILPLARECAGHQGDLWVIYMGNNEMVGPFGAATVFGFKAPPLWLVRASVALQRARFGQLLVRLGRQFQSRSLTSWHGMEMFTENKVPPDDPRRQVIYHSFARNLEQILESGLSAGVKVLLSTVAVNLKDCPPFASGAANPLSEAQRKRQEDLIAQGATAETGGKWAEAKQFYEQAVALSPDSAEVQYRLGRCFARAGDAAAARQPFQLAADRDWLPFRADSSINDVIRDAGRRFAGSNLALCDAAAALSHNSQTGIPGQESFYEHVHLNFDGNYRLALAWAEDIQKLLPPAVTGRAVDSWASQDACERRLGLTDWNRVSVFEEVGRRLGRPPFTGQLENATRLETVRAQVQVLRQRMTGAAIEAARGVYLEALRRTPDDPQLHENYAEFLDALHDTKAVIAEWRSVCELIPHYYLPFLNLGQVLKEQGHLAEAMESLQKAAVLAPRSAEVRMEIGTVYGRQGQWAKALAEFESARRLGSEDPRLLLYAAETLWKLGRSAESFDYLREAIRLQPDYWEAHYRLGDELASAGDMAGAAGELEQVLRLNPGHIKAHLNLGVALFKLGRFQEAARRFDETLRLDPSNAIALDFKRKAEQQGQRRK